MKPVQRENEEKDFFADEPVGKLAVEPSVKLYWRMVDDEKGFMEQILLPEGGEILFNHELGKIDFEPLRPHIGVLCHYYRDGEYKWTNRLKDIAPTIDGVMALFFSMELDPPEDDDEARVQMNDAEASV